MGTTEAVQKTHFAISQSRELRGTAVVPGDKSISHRVVLFGMLAEGTTRVRGWLAAGDTEASLRAVETLGFAVERADESTLTLHGGRLVEPGRPLDFVNAGTGIRLAAGIMAGQPFASVLDGSAQLRRRPMKRIIDPLRQMGAKVAGVDGHAPLSFEPASLRGMAYTLPVASAQVKSAILLAGLFAEERTTVIQPGPARDHTERMLRAMGADISSDDNRVTVMPGVPLQPLELRVPGDFSSAAFLITAAAIVPDSDITLTGVNLNATRTGLLDVLRAMGADIEVNETGLEGGEPAGSVRVRHTPLQGGSVGGEIVVRMIDEFPALMVAALCAEGRTEVRDAAELRVKETDRLAVMRAELERMGAQIEETPDGFRVDGPQQLTGAEVDGHDDHRIAMSLAVAGLVAKGETIVHDARCAADSFPGFAALLASLGGSIVEAGPVV